MMASVKSRLEESSTDNEDDSISNAAYSTFNPLATEDSTDLINGRNTYINGDPTHTDKKREQQVWHGVVKSQCCKCIDVTVTVVIIVLVWVVMSMPTIFYAKTVV